MTKLMPSVKARGTLMPLPSEITIIDEEVAKVLSKDVLTN